jgi:hypothetical protein
VIILIPAFIIAAIAATFAALSEHRFRRDEWRRTLRLLDKREPRPVHQQRVADVVNITGWRTFRQRRAQETA